MVSTDIKNRKREDYPFILDYRTRWYVDNAKCTLATMPVTSKYLCV